MKIERWAVSRSEVDNPSELTSHDELLASIIFRYDGDDHNTLDNVIVLRNGTVTDCWEDGEKIDPLCAALAAELAREEKTLINPRTHDTTDFWRDVEVTEDGRFIRFLPA